jgi:hypothetical protein
MAGLDLSTKIQYTEAHLVSDGRLTDKSIVRRRLPPLRTVNISICCTICFEHTADVLWILDRREKAEMSERFMNKVRSRAYGKDSDGGAGARDQARIVPQRIS